MIFKELKNKTWIDWVKIIVAIDIAGVGIGLVLGFNLHVFAYIFGFLSRIVFGIMYVFVAVLIFKRIFPQDLAQEEHAEAKKMNTEIIETANIIKKRAEKIVKKISKITDTTHTQIDNLLDKGQESLKKGRKEVREELKKLIKD